VSLKDRIVDDMKVAMRAKDAPRLSAIRLLLAAIKQREVDERIELTDADVLSVIEKMSKQRRESISQYEAAGRKDLADAEAFELALLKGYLPEPMTESEIEAVIRQSIQDCGASSLKDMGKVMAIIKPKLAGRADVGHVSALVKAKLG
jgi:uncharacterized protein YqeY